MISLDNLDAALVKNTNIPYTESILGNLFSTKKIPFNLYRIREEISDLFIKKVFSATLCLNFHLIFNSISEGKGAERTTKCDLLKLAVEYRENCPPLQITL